MNQFISISSQITTPINYAMQQNYVPLMRSFTINNETAQRRENLLMVIRFEPAFAKEFIYPIAPLEPYASMEITPVKIVMATEFLFSLTEKIVGNMTILVKQGDETIYEDNKEIDLLAYDEWAGISLMPEMIGAFVTPNHPRIAAVISHAAQYLQKWGVDPSFNAYITKNPNIVKQQMGAIYAALQAERINYVVHPASFEERGQRIRLPHMVLEQKQGTCLDLALLYASCLEAVGLNALLIFQKGHAYAGCWLEEETFADCALDDVTALQKRIVEGAQELILVEATDFVIGKNADFEASAKHGADHLKAEADFLCVIDILRSRNSGIRPIATILEKEELLQHNPDNAGVNGIVETQAPKALDTSLVGKVAVNDTQMTRQKIWERKLLDFSLRNTLLNFRVTKSAIQLMTADLGELEDQLTDGKDFTILGAPTEWTSTLRDAKMFEIETERDLIESIAKEEFKNNRIRSFLNSMDLEQNLKSLHRAARSSMEENGTNTLFLALGFLKWYETKDAERARYAPLVLIPVDLVRNMRNKGYVIRSRDEEAQINITLLEYLRQDHEIKIGGLDPLPMDEHGIDLQLVFNTIRQSIMEKARWNIENMAFIGLFSFGQFVMWNDLRNRTEDLKKNKVINSLMEGRMSWIPEVIDITADNLDEVITPSSMAIPLSADSSQMVAIATAAKGQSFVLHGPPGTGKSQTITNMIANALYQGQSVLFVAEKMAALNVVQKRLTAVGLDPFCLELHSNKTSKNVVLGQLEQALEVGRIKKPEEYQKTAEQIHALRKELNHVIEAIHEKRYYGMSLYETIAGFERNREQKNVIRLDKSVLESMTPEELTMWQSAVEEYEIAIHQAGGYLGHVLLGMEGTEYSMELRDELAQEITLLQQQGAKAKEAASKLRSITGANWSEDYEGTLTLRLFGNLLQDETPVLIDLAAADNYDGLRQQIDKIIATGKAYRQLQGELLQTYDAQIASYQIGDAMLRYKKASTSWALPKWLGINKLVKELKLYTKNPAAVTKANLQQHLEQLQQMQNWKEELVNAPANPVTMLNGFYQGTDTDFEKLEHILRKTEQIESIAGVLEPEAEKNFLEAFRHTPERAAVRSQVSLLESFILSLEQIGRKRRWNWALIEEKEPWLDAALQKLTDYANNLTLLKTWSAQNAQEEKLKGMGLGCVVEAYHEGRMDADHVMAAYYGNLCYTYCTMTIAADSKLSSFQGKQYESMIQQYDALIKEFQKLTIQEMVARLSANVPVADAGSAVSSDIGILKKAIKSNGRMMSIRKLFDQIPTLLRKLSPCMLMSPISVAQYIDPSFPKFDLVIFDEASQLPTSEAVGTIARGENVIVVGDPKQLPPTSFFTSNRVDEENYEQEDLESLLDDCLAISMPQDYLKWHYRSRHESLIAYSNAKYYENKLYTFPSPNDLISEVKLVQVEGFYDKGKTKQNRAEAEAVVAEIIRRLSDEQLRNDSIGVVTFSSVQQNLIEDMLVEELAKYPELEELDHKSKEPIFVKNLENVQGDERDVILFSIGYGPDQEGKVSMNFGPLNRDGGWRRLNVAISRARKSMIVYAIIRPEQIDVGRTRSEGVAGLKGFLEFASRGKSALASREGDNCGSKDGLVTDIAEAIQSLGYQVKINIGCSAYRMDIGIVHPDNEEKYLLGILLDGDNCYQSATAKDRFVLQPSVLNGLGWQLYRVWVMEWLDNPQAVLEEIKQAAKTALHPKQETIKEDPVEEKSLSFEKEMVTAESISRKIAYLAMPETIMGKAEEFTNPMSLPKIKQTAIQIIVREAPISKALLLHKLYADWGISRTGSRMEETFESMLKEIELIKTKDNNHEFLWLSNQNPTEYENYRVEDQFGNRRNIEDIPSQEIINAIIEILEMQVSLSREDLIRETGKRFGFTRLGTVMENVVTLAIDKGIQQGKITRGAGEKIVKR